MLTCYRVPTEGTSPHWCEAFAKGAGGRVTESRRLLKGDMALFGSPKLWRIFTQAREQGRTFYYGDHAYFRRFEYYRITKNALVREPVPVDGVDDSRFNLLGVKIERWRSDGAHVLVCPPDDLFSSLIGLDAHKWLDDALATLAANTEREIRVRDRFSTGPLTDDLVGCHALVTYHSNAAVEALCFGVPVFVTGFGAAKNMGYVDLSKIEAPRYPVGRYEWACALANSQWTLDEMASGKAWSDLNAIL